jgi:hypothetical protein
MNGRVTFGKVRGGHVRFRVAFDFSMVDNDRHNFSLVTNLMSGSPFVQ